MAYRLLTPPAENPVSLEAMKLHSRIDTDADDEILEHYIAAATQFCEEYQRRAYVTQTWELWLDDFPKERWIQLTPSPLRVDNLVIRTYDEDGNFYPFTDFQIDNISEPGYVILNDGASWPQPLRFANSVYIRFNAGYGTADDVPRTMIQAIVMLAAHWYENREAVTATGAVPQQVPFSVKVLLNQSKVYLL
jgi:uncharacterized phiE125 gp8 family phage protein